jgi:hypothetical protein
MEVYRIRSSHPEIIVLILIKIALKISVLMPA